MHLVHCAGLSDVWCRMAAFFSAKCEAISQEVADGKINVQSACVLNTQYIGYDICHIDTMLQILLNVWINSLIM
jgi:hypothetical protein